MSDRLRSEQISKADFFIRNNLTAEPDFERERYCLVSISTKPVRVFNFGRVEKFTEKGIALEDGTYKYFNRSFKLIPCDEVALTIQKVSEVEEENRKKVKEAEDKIKELDAKIIREARQRAKEQFDKLRAEKSKCVKNLAKELEKAFWG